MQLRPLLGDQVVAADEAADLPLLLGEADLHASIIERHIRLIAHES